MFTHRISTWAAAAAAVVTLTLAPSPAGAAESPLAVGKPLAFPKPVTWITGGPMTAFPSNQPVIVLLFAPEDPKVKEALVEYGGMARRLKTNAVFCALSVARDEAGQSNLVETTRSLVRGLGPEVSFPLGVVEDAALRTAWLGASRRQGLPFAVVTDARGSISWMGAPARGLEPSLQRALANAQESRSQAWRMDEFQMRLSELRRQGKPKEALAEFDRVVTNFFTATPRQQSQRISLLFDADPEAARAEIRRLADGPLTNHPPVIAGFASQLLGGRRTAADKALSLELAQRANAQTGGGVPSIVSTLARAYAANGQPQKAADLMEELLQRESNSGIGGGAARGFYQSELESYRRAASGTNAPPRPPLLLK